MENRVVIDTSVFLAILLQENDAKQYRQALLDIHKALVSSATMVEMYIVVSHRLGAEGIILLNQMLASDLFEVKSVTPEQAEIAQNGYLRYGKGRDPAGLNFGDLFSYALAKQEDLPLLFKGFDFSKTDLYHI
ncbi:hypothetical protein SPONN_1641 [uncultured Candidatus Thioglobus sp.]|nr:hypothetical protein SPONN_1641 [uncultured Candidatus Thioglobus sp.]